MRTKNPATWISALLVGFLGFTLATLGQQNMTPVDCEWRLMSNRFLPEDPVSAHDHKIDRLLGVPGAAGHASVFSTGNQVHGNGMAHDWDIGTSVKVAVNAQRLQLQTWDEISSEEGRATIFETTLEIEGEVNLQGLSAAAALGYVEFECTISPTVTAALTKSVGQTAAGQLDFTFDKWGLTIPVPVQLPVSGEGLFKDKDNNAALDNQECLDRFSVRHRTRGDIEVFADKGFLGRQAKSKAKMKGRVESIIVLDCCPEGS